MSGYPKCWECGQGTAWPDGTCHYCPKCSHDYCQPCGYRHELDGCSTREPLQVRAEDVLWGDRLPGGSVVMGKSRPGAHTVGLLVKGPEGSWSPRDGAAPSWHTYGADELLEVWRD